MANKLYTLTQSEFLKHNVTLFAGSMVVAVFNYAYHPVLGRMLGVEEFGEVQTLISLFMQLAMLLGIFRVMAINILSNYKPKEAHESLEALYILASVLTLMLAIIMVAASGLLRDFFHFSSAMPFIILAALFCTGVPVVFGEAALQSRHHFAAVSISQSITAIGKLFFAMGLVWWGWAATGAVGGILVAQFLSIIYLYRQDPQVLRLSRGEFHLKRRVKNALLYAVSILVVTLTTSLIFSGDMLVVKHYFSEEVAGQYGGMAIIGRIIFFLTASVVAVMLPGIKMNNPQKNRQMLRKSLALLLVVGGFATALFTFFPAWVIGLMLGQKYLSLTHHLPLLSLAMLLVSLYNLLAAYMLALRDTRATGIALGGVATFLALSFSHHSSVEAVIVNSLISALVLLIPSLYLIKSHTSDGR